MKCSLREQSKKKMVRKEKWNICYNTYMVEEWNEMYNEVEVEVGKIF